MLKKARFELIIIISLVWIAILSIAGFFIYDLYISEEQFFKITERKNISIVDDTITEDYPEGMLFYPNIRFPKKQITFSIDSCESSKIESTKNAFEILAEETVLEFLEIPANGQIIATCSDNFEQTESEYFIAGEGGPNYILDNQNYQIIFNGTIFLYKENQCENPIIAIHEILHALGFKHSSNESSIMYPVSYCEQKITSEIVDKIAKLYQDPSLPDLVFTNVNASKKGRYLNFEAVILNQGLEQSQDTTLLLTSQDNDELKTYSLESFEIGKGKILKVENLRVPRSLKKLIFSIDYENSIQEINEENNRVILELIDK